MVAAANSVVEDGSLGTQVVCARESTFASKQSHMVFSYSSLPCAGPSAPVQCVNDHRLFSSG